MALVLGVSQKEASESLGKGDTGFIIKADLPKDFSPAVTKLLELHEIHPSASFYAGLLLSGEKALPEGSTRSARQLEILLFCATLEGASLPARQRAAERLVPLILETENPEAENILIFLERIIPLNETDNYIQALRYSCLYRLGRYHDLLVHLFSEYPKEDLADPATEIQRWVKALYYFTAWRAGMGNAVEKEIPDFLFGLPPGEIRRWAYAEAVSLTENPLPVYSHGLLEEDEYAAIMSRLTQADYRGILLIMNREAEKEVPVFIRHPDLIVDLGRAFQNTPLMREAGVKLFSSLESSVESFGLDYDIQKKGRYLLLHYLGRIERARERYTSSSEYFRKALEFAPDHLQADACIWYLLMNAFSASPPGSVTLVLETMDQWNDISYFDDVLDRLSSYLTGRRQWSDLQKIFTRLEGRKSSGVSLARYAWILGRAAQEGYFTSDRKAEEYLRIAFEKGNWSFYYRAMAASKLGEILAHEPNPETGADDQESPGEELKFILGFYKYGASSFAQQYVREAEARLSVPELRKIAEAMSALNMTREYLNLVTRYTGRDDYEIDRRDLYLLYPRPFVELTEKYARDANLGAEILFGLIRTESYFQSDVVSRAGAVGLAQLMPPTAEDMAGRLARRGGPEYRGPDGIDLRDPEVNIHLGSYYLRYLTEQMGNPMLALLAYNGGMGRMRRWLNQDRSHSQGPLPQDLFLETIEYAETREYGRRVLAAAAVYGYLYYGMTMEEVAEDIYR